MDTQSLEIARTYDQVPYTSRPFPQSQPQRLAALARLFGLTPPDVSYARILELGCAGGGNLIPLAASFPHANFTGVDLSPVQVAEGQARIARLGLKNIRLINMSISDITAGLGLFDYVICHGVYSWVPAAVRDAILRVSRENLTEHGVAYISYNVYPGWRLRTVLRDAMMFHAETSDNPAEKIALGRDVLNKLGNLTNAGSAYGQMLRHEAQNISRLGDDYIAHEYFEINNAPCYVNDFMKRAELFDLGFLTETDLHLTIAENFGAETGALLRSLSGNRLDRMEQYIDFLTGRTFRQSVLVRRDQVQRIERVLSPASLNGLHLSTSVEPEPVIDGDRFIFKDAAGRTLTTTSPDVRNAVQRLARLFPQTASIEDLTSGHKPEAQDAGGIARSLFNMVLAGMAEISTVPVVVNANISDRPAAGILARADAESGMEWTTNVRHETVPLSLVARAVLPMLDGTNDHGAIRLRVETLVQDGKLRFFSDGATIEDPDQIDAAITEHIASALNGFQRSALLMP
jgi:methyltransferase-like protein/cyclopropane fatty-acyl-phospholipid synthase-like methyltransferase